MPTNVRDPRSIITPDAFEIDPALLGTPLARPWKRLVALVIDLGVIGVLTSLTSGLGVFIWGLVGLFFLQMAFRRPGHRMGQFASVLFRGSAGCLGAIILTVVVIVGIATMISRNEEVSSRIGSALSETVAGRLGIDALDGIGPVVDLRNARTREDAERAAQELLGVAAGLSLEVGTDDRGLAEALHAFMGEAPDYTDDPEAFAQEMVQRFRAGARPDSVEPEPTPLAPEQVEAMDLATVAARYEAGLAAGRTPETDGAQALLRSRLLDAVASDTLERLQDALASEEGRRSRAEGRLIEAQAQVQQQGSGVVALLRDIWEQAGSAVGLWSIYFTVTLTLFRGFTVGKRVMGIRVVRLDGEPFTWWTAFERGGGYVAGIATGLLGFAQVFWDPNRQCVHDKIVGTAVVVAGAAPIPGAVESTWTEASGKDS